MNPDHIDLPSGVALLPGALILAINRVLRRMAEKEVGLLVGQDYDGSWYAAVGRWRGTGTSPEIALVALAAAMEEKGG